MNGYQLTPFQFFSKWTNQNSDMNAVLSTKCFEPNKTQICVIQDNGKTNGLATLFWRDALRQLRVVDKIQKIQTVLTDTLPIDEEEVYVDLTKDLLLDDIVSKLSFSVVKGTYDIVAIESIHAFFLYSMEFGLSLIQKIKQKIPQGLIVLRYNQACCPVQVGLMLKSIVDCEISIETHLSISTYSLLERKNYPLFAKEMDGICIIIRRNKMGKISRTVESFRILPSNVISWEKASSSSKEQISSEPLVQSTFNLSLSQAEQENRSKVVLPYQHTGLNNSLNQPQMLYIDPDDLEWDDDDLDDDLDI